MMEITFHPGMFFFVLKPVTKMFSDKSTLVVKEVGSIKEILTHELQVFTVINIQSTSDEITSLCTTSSM